jgi:hypothetical protein
MTPEITSILGGTLSFTAGNHRYMWNNEKVDLSVSSVAGAYPVSFSIPVAWAAKLIRLELLASKEIGGIFDDEDAKLEWAKAICKAPNNFTKAAGETGTKVHKYIEDAAHGLTPDLDEDPAVAKCQQSVGDWFKANIAEVISVERRIYSERYKIAGTLDMIAKLKSGKIHILDWKGVTDLKKAGLKAGHVGQLAAYRKMVEDMGEHIDGTTLVRFSRATGEVDPINFTNNYAEDLAAFEAALTLSRYKPQTENF